LPDDPQVKVKALSREAVHYLLVRSRSRQQKERAIRRRQRRSLSQGLQKLAKRILAGRLKNRDKIVERVGRLKGHILVCILAYALWKTLDHLAKRAGLLTEIRKPDPERPDSPQPRPMTPEVILGESSCYAGLTFSAHGPFLPMPSVYVTFCPSCRSLKLTPWTTDE
jgi:hypothetical protein